MTHARKETMEMNSKTTCVKAQVNKFSNHITMLQKTQGKDYKSPFRKPDQSITSGDYLKQSICFVVEREKKLRDNCNFSLFLQTLR